MKGKAKNKKVVILLSIVIFIQVMVRIGVGMQKEYYHMDEMYSYGLMHYDKISITENTDFYEKWHDKTYYEEYLKIGQENMTDFSGVYRNQKDDVHPPLYYLGLRVASSFDVNQFSKWSGIIFNICISIASSIVVYLLAKKIVKKELVAIAICFLTGLTISAIEMTMFIRMYELANFFVLLTAYLHLKNIEKEKIEIKECFKMGIVATLGSLTHYYYIIFLAGIFVIFLYRQIKNKRWENVKRYVISMVLAGAISLLIFPHSITHIFFGYRGKDALGSMQKLSIESIGIHMIAHIGIFSIHVWNLASALLVVIFLFVFCKGKEKNKQISLLAIPSIFYFFIVANCSPYMDIRYMLMITSLITTVFLCYMYQKLQIRCNEKVSILAWLSISILLVLSPQFANAKIDFVYPQYKEIVQKIEELSDLPTIYRIKKDNNRFLDDLYLFSKIEKSCIIEEEEKFEELLKQEDMSKGMLLFCGDGLENEQIIDQIKDEKELQRCEKLYRTNSATIYYIY